MLTLVIIYFVLAALAISEAMSAVESGHKLAAAFMLVFSMLSTAAGSIGLNIWWMS